MSTSIINHKEKHDESLVSLIIAGVLAFMLGLVFWFTSQNGTNNTTIVNTDQKNDIRSEVASLLQNAKTQASQAELDRVANAIQKSKVKATSVEKAKVSSVLENI